MKKCFSRLCAFVTPVLILLSLTSCVRDSAWKKYYDKAFADQTAGDDLINELGVRVSKIANNLSATDRAKVYADCSVILAKYGREKCNWLDGQDSTRTDGDPGRGVSKWHDHYDYMRRQPPEPMFASLMKSRLADLKTNLSKEDFARVYADLCSTLDKAGASKPSE